MRVRQRPTPESQRSRDGVVDAGLRSHLTGVCV